MPDRKTTQYENDVARLKARAELIVSSLDEAPEVNQDNLNEAVRFLRHAFLYLEAAIK